MSSKLDEVYVAVTAKRDQLNKDFDKIHTDTKNTAKNISKDFKKNALIRFDNRLAKKSEAQLLQMQARLKKAFAKKVELGVKDASLIRTKTQIKKVDSAILKLNKDSEKTKSKFGSLAAKAKLLGGVLAGAFVVKKIFSFGKAAVKTAMEFEMLRSRLVALKGSQEEATKTFEIYKKVAATTPFDLKGLTEAGAAMEAFGIDSQKHLKTTADLAAYMGISAQEAASAWGRAWAGGAGAADIFRERGVLNLIKMKTGIKDLTKLTKEEFQQTMVGVFTDTAHGIAGATDIISKTATGGISNLQDAMDAWADTVFKGTMPMINKLARGMGAFVKKITPVETELEKVTQKSHEQRLEFETLINQYESLRKNTEKTKAEQERYSTVISTLSSKYGEYLGNINLEKEGYEKVKIAIDGARVSLAAKAKEMAVYATQKDLLENVARIEGEILQQQLKQAKALAEINIQKEKLIEVGAISEGEELTGVFSMDIEEGKIASSTLKIDKLREKLEAANANLTLFTSTNSEAIANINESSEKVVGNSTKTAETATVIKEKTEETAFWMERVHGETAFTDEGLVRMVDSANLLPGPLSAAADNIARMKEKNKKIIEGFKKTKIEALDIKQTLGIIDSDLNAGIVNGLTDALLKTKSWGEALAEVGKRFTDIALSFAFKLGLSFILPDGGLLSGLGKLFGFAGGGSISNVNGKPVLGGANGLNFTVPPGFPNDSFPIAVQSGEHVQVTPAGQSPSTNVTLNIQTLDPVGFSRWIKTDGRSAMNDLLADIKDRGRG